MEFIGFLIGAFLELCWIVISGFVNLMVVLFIEFFKYVFKLGCAHLYISIPILIVIVAYIFIKIYGAISRAINYSKPVVQKETILPICYNSVVYTNS